MGTILIIILLISYYLLIKNFVTRYHHARISDAIHEYHKEIIDNHNYFKGYPVFQVEYEDIEEYEKTLFRFWDWSDKRILPKEKYEIIKPYLSI